jgi:hypothetical protein
MFFFSLSERMKCSGAYRSKNVRWGLLKRWSWLTQHPTTGTTTQQTSAAHESCSKLQKVFSGKWARRFWSSRNGCAVIGSLIDETIWVSQSRRSAIRNITCTTNSPGRWSDDVWVVDETRGVSNRRITRNRQTLSAHSGLSGIGGVLKSSVWNTLSTASSEDFSCSRLWC